MSHTDAAAEDGAEARMRQALGKLGIAKPGKPDTSRRTTYQTTPGAGRHRFKQDGEVPVIRLSIGKGGGGKERQSQASADRIEAQVAHGRAKRGGDQDGGDIARQVQELAEQLRATQTRLGHAELALQEAGRVAQARQEEAAGLRRALDAAEADLAQVRAELAASERAREGLERSRCAKRHPDPEPDGRKDTAKSRKVGRPLGSINRVRDQVLAGEPEPVKWWAGD